MECDRTKCTVAKDGWIIMGVKTVKCSNLFGDCSECSPSGCSKCNDDLVPIYGFCRKCSDIFEDSCNECDESGCTSCAADSGKELVNGACVDCAQAYGAGCTQCDNTTGCSEASYGYFVMKKFSFSCFVLPEEIQSLCFETAITRDLAIRNDEEIPTTSEPSDSIIFTMFEREVSVPCSNMTDSCELCVDDDGQAKCTQCKSGYLLVGWTCKPCSAQFPEGHCSECSSSGCTKCEDESMEISMNGQCIRCKDEEELFDTTTKTCVECGTMFSRCSKCTKDMCTGCEGAGDQSMILDAETGACQTCSEVHGSGCTTCNDDKCETCTSDLCCKDGKKIVVDPKSKKAECGYCSVFDVNCSECSSTTCTKCSGEDMFIDPDTGKCVSCSERFVDCGRCTADVCTACIDTDPTKYILTNEGCAQFETDVEPSSSLPQSQSVVPSSTHGSSSANTTTSSSQPIVKPSSAGTEEDGGSKAGMIVGIVVGCLVVAAIIGVAVYFFVTKGAKHGKIDSDIYEDDPNFVSMSVL